MRKISFARPLPTPAPASIFRLTRPVVDERTVADIAAQLHVYGESSQRQWRRDPESLALVIGPHVVTLYRASGAVQYYDERRWQVDDGRSHIQISDEEAIVAARRLVDRFSLASSSAFEPLKVTRLHVGVVRRDGRHLEERVIDVGVVFQRAIDGLAVGGAGGKLTVYVDHNGEMTGFERIARPIAGVHQRVERFQPPEHVMEEVARYWVTEGGSITIESARAGYFEHGRAESQEFIQPAYLLDLRFETMVDQPGHRAQFAVAAAIDSVGTLLPLPKEPVQQLARDA